MQFLLAILEQKAQEIGDEYEKWQHEGQFSHSTNTGVLLFSKERGVT